MTAPDRPPPQAPEAEEHVLGQLLTAGADSLDHAERVAERIAAAGLTPGDFYRESHARILRACQRLLDRGEPPDPLLVEAELDLGGELGDAGGRARLRELASLVAATANAGHYARLVVDAARRRDLIRTLGPVVDAAWNGGAPADTIDRLDRARAQLTPGAPDDHRLEPLDLAELLAGPPPAARWLWRGWLAQGDLALLVGDPGVGKSLLTLALAAAVRRGVPLLDEPCYRGRVGVLDLENPLDEAHKRLRAVGVTATEHDGLVYVHQPALDLGTAAGIAAVQDLLDRHQLDALVIDSLRRAAPGLEENDSAAVSRILSPLRALTAASSRTIVLVHHARKRIGDNPTDAGQMVRGSGDLLASADTLLYLRAKEAGIFTLEQGKSRRGVAHESIQVRIDSDDDRLDLVNEGAVAHADDRLEAMLERIIGVLREHGSPLERQVIALRLGAGNRDGTFARALKLGWQRDLLGKTNEETRKPTEPMVYGLAEWAR